MTKIVFALMAVVIGGGALAGVTYPRLQEPRTFTYQELVKLPTTDSITGPLGLKLHTIVTTPFVSNEAYYRGARPHRPVIEQLGPSLRVVAWNIERGLQLDGIKLLFANSEQFLAQAGRHDATVDIPQMRRDIEVMKSADVFVLNEVDWGLKRSGYRAVVRELGTVLNMNWAYGVEFIEVDSITLGTEKLKEWPDAVERRRLLAEIRVDSTKLKALHGTAVLSRYPIVEARLEPFQTIGYDWYTGEKQALDVLEKGKRVGAAQVFLEKTTREIRRGGRNALVVTLDVPDLEGKRLTVAATHLENNASPERRRAQMEELLVWLQDIPTPVILAGDLNTTGGNSSPTSIKKQIYQRLGSASFWTNTGIKYATGIGVLYDVVRRSLNIVKNQDDPTARNIPLVAGNAEAALFGALEDFRFQDGRAFDFRGDKARTINGTEGTLANSNHRDTKGFSTTFEFERSTGLVGRLKLDWILVKSGLTSPRDENGPYRFAPHFARTLGAINYALPTRLSDHDPISVDLPFAEPLPSSDNIDED